MKYLKSYGVGTKAYLDTVFSGLVACEIVEIKPLGDVVVKITAKKNKHYKQGEILTQHAHWVVPKECVKWRSCGMARILNNYKYE